MIYQVRRILDQATVSSRAPWLVFGLAFGVRLVVAVIWPEVPDGGDSYWYWTVAQNLVNEGTYTFTHGLAEGVYARPPGHAFVLAMLMGLLGTSPILLGAVYAAVSASGGVALLGIARDVVPERPRIPVVAGLLYAVDPVQAWLPRTFLVESLAVPVTLWFVWLCLQVARHPRTAHAVAAGLLGGFMVYLRIDLLALVVGVPALALLFLPERRRHLPRFALALVIAAALCVPWSVHVSRQTGSTAFMLSVPERDRGFSEWLLTHSMSSREWTTAFWYQGRGLHPDDLPPSVYATDRNGAAARELIAAASAPDADREAIGQRFADFAADRRRSDPFRHYILLPLERSVRMWLHYEMITGQAQTLFGSASPGAVLLSVWKLPFVPVVFLGFVASWIYLVSMRSGRAFIGGVVLLRTYSMLAAGLLAGVALYEVRYLAPAEPLALLAAVVLFSDAVARRRAPSSTAMESRSLAASNEERLG